MRRNRHIALTGYAAENWGLEGTKYHKLFLNLRNALPKKCKLSVERMHAVVYFLENFDYDDSRGLRLMSVPVCGFEAMEKRIKRLRLILECSDNDSFYTKLNQLLNLKEIKPN